MIFAAATVSALLALMRLASGAMKARRVSAGAANLAPLGISGLWPDSTIRNPGCIAEPVNDCIATTTIDSPSLRRP